MLKITVRPEDSMKSKSPYDKLLSAVTRKNSKKIPLQLHATYCAFDVVYQVIIKNLPVNM
tara:strand:+ start:196 stop:375 length:180 start_codon:yes stop_codon:yes gene_type:complete